MIYIITYYHIAGMLLSLTAAAPTAAQFRWPITIISSRTPPLDQSETVFTVTRDQSSLPSTISAVFRHRWSTVRLRATGTRRTNRWRSTNRWEWWYSKLQSRIQIVIIIIYQLQPGTLVSCVPSNRMNLRNSGGANRYSFVSPTGFKFLKLMFGGRGGWIILQN